MAEQPRPAFGPGSFMWWECATRDLAASKSFYSRALGWKYDEMDMGPGGKYQIIKTGTKSAGGMMAIGGAEWGDIPSHWGYYIDVEDVDASAARVEKLGGKLVRPPSDIPDVGRFCTIQDPSGAYVSLMTPREHATEPSCHDPGCFIWVELVSRDFDKARAFYCELLGWKTQDMPMPDGVYTIFGARSGNVGGGMPMPQNVPGNVPSNWVGYVHVADIDKTCRDVQAAGGTLFSAPMDIEGVGRFTQIQDPAGAVVAIMQPAPMSGG